MSNISLFCVPEGGKGGASANPDRGVDPSRLDLRIGKILSAKKVNMLRKAISFFVGKCSPVHVSVSFEIDDESKCSHTD